MNSIINDNRVPYLYKWTHIPSQKWYVGSKTSKNCHPDKHEKYISSSKLVTPLIKANRVEWSYEILVIGAAPYIRLLEKQYLQLYNAKDDPMSFNQSNAHCSFDRTGCADSIETRKKKSDSRKGALNPMFGKRGEECPHYGKLHSQQWKDNQSNGVKKYASNRPDTHNQNISKSLKGNPNVGLSGSKNPRFGKPGTMAGKKMPTLICPYCGTEMAAGNYQRYHGENCKHKDELAGRVNNIMTVTKENGFTTYSTDVEVI